LVAIIVAPQPQAAEIGLEVMRRVATLSTPP